MKMTKSILALLLFPGLALASNYRGAETLQEQHQGQNQNQHQDQSQNQDQYQTIGDVSNDQSVTFTSPKDVTVRNTASAPSPAIFSSNPCAIGGSFGLGLPGGNIGGGKQKVDPQCELRETARILISAGEVELGIKMLCMSDAAMASLGDACVPSTNHQNRIAELENQVAVLLQEREFDRQECDDSKDRIIEACQK